MNIQMVILEVMIVISFGCIIALTVVCKVLIKEIEKLKEAQNDRRD